MTRPRVPEPNPNPTPSPATEPKPLPLPPKPNCDEEEKKCIFSIDEQHLFYPDTRSGNLQGFHSTARTLEGIDYNWVVPPSSDADFEPFGAYFTIPGQPQFRKKFSTFFPIKATVFAVTEVIGKAYVKSGCHPNGAWSASVSNPVASQAMGVQGTALNHVIQTAFPS